MRFPTGRLIPTLSPTRSVAQVMMSGIVNSVITLLRAVKVTESATSPPASLENTLEELPPGQQAMRIRPMKKTGVRRKAQASPSAMAGRRTICPNRAIASGSGWRKTLPKSSTLSEDPLAGFVCLLGIPAGLDDLGEEILHGLPDGGCLFQERVGIPFKIVLLGLGKMVRIRRVAIGLSTQLMFGHAFVLVVDKDVVAVVMQVDLLPDQGDRDAVIMLFQADVAVLLDGGNRPFLDLEPMGILRRRK